MDDFGKGSVITLIVQIKLPWIVLDLRPSYCGGTIKMGIRSQDGRERERERMYHRREEREGGRKRGIYWRDETDIYARCMPAAHTHSHELSERQKIS